MSTDGTSRWLLWLAGIAGGLVVAAVSGQTIIMISREGRISKLEVQMEAMETGRSTPMSRVTRGELDRIFDRLGEIDKRLNRIERKTYGQKALEGMKGKPRGFGAAIGPEPEPLPKPIGEGVGG